MDDPNWDALNHNLRVLAENSNYIVIALFLIFVAVIIAGC